MMRKHEENAGCPDVLLPHLICQCKPLRNTLGRLDIAIDKPDWRNLNAGMVRAGGHDQRLKQTALAALEQCAY
jgi:hypothetical protein